MDKQTSASLPFNLPERIRARDVETMERIANEAGEDLAAHQRDRAKQAERSDEANAEYRRNNAGKSRHDLAMDAKHEIAADLKRRGVPHEKAEQVALEATIRGASR